MKKERLLSLLAGIALLGGFFLPWISFFGMSLSGLTLAQASFSAEAKNIFGGIFLLLLPLGGLGLIAYSLIPKENSKLKQISGTAVVIVFLYVLVSIIGNIGKSTGGISQLTNILGIGFYITVAGIVLSIVDLIRSFSSKPSNN